MPNPRETLSREYGSHPEGTKFINFYDRDDKSWQVDTTVADKMATDPLFGEFVNRAAESIFSAAIRIHVPFHAARIVTTVPDWFYLSLAAKNKTGAAAGIVVTTSPHFANIVSGGGRRFLDALQEPIQAYGDSLPYEERKVFGRNIRLQIISPGDKKEPTWWMEVYGLNKTDTAHAYLEDALEDPTTFTLFGLTRTTTTEPHIHTNRDQDSPHPFHGIEVGYPLLNPEQQNELAKKVAQAMDEVAKRGLPSQVFGRKDKYYFHDLDTVLETFFQMASQMQKPELFAAPLQRMLKKIGSFPGNRSWEVGMCLKEAIEANKPRLSRSTM